MSQNQFLPFATGDGANTMTAAQFGALGAVPQGFRSGIASSMQMNTLFRQVSTIAAMIGQFMADNQGADVLDNGAVTTLESQFGAALKGLLSDSTVHYGVATGTTDAMVVTAVPPVQPTTSGTIRPGTLLFAKTCAGANTSAAPTLNANALGNVAVAKRNDAALMPGDLPASTWVPFFFDGTAWTVVGLTPGDIPGLLPPTSLWHTSGDTSTTAASIIAPVSPAVPTRVPLAAYLVYPNHACAGPTTLNVGFGPVALTRNDTSPLQPGDYVLGQPLVIVDDGTQFRIVDLTLAQVQALVPAATSSVINSLSITGGRLAFFNASGTWACPAGVTKARVIGQAGGGGGGGANGNAGAGGGGGNSFQGVFDVVPGATYAVTVGAGGTAGAGATPGGNGGSTSFGPQGGTALATALGGAGGGSGNMGSSTGVGIVGAPPGLSGITFPHGGFELTGGSALNGIVLSGPVYQGGAGGGASYASSTPGGFGNGRFNGTGYGAGGSGGSSDGSGSSVGGTGSGGLLIIEY